MPISLVPALLLSALSIALLASNEACFADPSHPDPAKVVLALIVLGIFISLSVPKLRPRQGIIRSSLIATLAALALWNTLAVGAKAVVFKSCFSCPPGTERLYSRTPYGWNLSCSRDGKPDGRTIGERISENGERAYFSESFKNGVRDGEFIEYPSNANPLGKTTVYKDGKPLR